MTDVQQQRQPCSEVRQVNSILNVVVLRCDSFAQSREKDAPPH